MKLEISADSQIELSLNADELHFLAHAATHLLLEPKASSLATRSKNSPITCRNYQCNYATRRHHERIRSSVSNIHSGTWNSAG